MSEHTYPTEAQYTIGQDISHALRDVEEFGRGNSPAVKGLLQGIDAEPAVVLACDDEQDEDTPFVYVRVFDAVDFEAAAVVMEFRDEPDAVYVGEANEVYPALSELAENDYCWTVKDTHSIAETYIEQ